MAVTLSIDGTKIVLNDGLDANEDGSTDVAEGVRVVAEFPTNPKKGDIVLKDGQLYVCTEID